MVNKELDIFLLTFNCGKKGVDEEAFASKLTKALPKKLANFYAFGFEEFCSIMEGSFKDVSNNMFIKANQLLLRILSKWYNQGFQTVSLNHKGAIGLIILTPYPLQVLKVRNASSSCGYFYSSMKGAVATRITFKTLVGSSESRDITFATAHLSAYEGQYYCTKRNAQVLKLMRALDFEDGYSFLKPGSHTFFMGDLNYRTVHDVKKQGDIVEELASLQDQTITKTDSIEDLVQKYDELSKCISNDEVFMGFTEACIDFQPTYKYHVGCAIYKTTRAPSWCDRILYQSTYNSTFIKKKTDKVLPQIGAYNSIKNVFSSDHQPVYLSITIPFDPPQSIISDTGYLKILPNDQFKDHFHRKKLTVGSVDTSSGPTQIYMKATVTDKIINFLITPVSDTLVGNSLWFTTTPNGRITLLVSFLILVSAIWFLK